MDEKSIKETLRALAQRSGLTLTNLREHPALWETLDLAGPEELRAYIVDHLAKLEGTREGITLRQAYGLEGPSGVPGSLTSRRNALAKDWGVSIDTLKRYERSAVDQLYLWMFPQALPMPGDSGPSDFHGPIELDMSEPDSSTTLFRGEGMRLALSRMQTPGAGPAIEYWFDESFIDSDRQVYLFYIRPHRDMVESLLQFQFGRAPVFIRFNVDPEPDMIRIGFQGPARPSQVVWGETPDPGGFSPEALKQLSAETGATNGEWLGLVHNGTPTVTTSVILRDFVAEWVEEDRGPQLIRTGLLIPIYRPQRTRRTPRSASGT